MPELNSQYQRSICENRSSIGMIAVVRNSQKNQPRFPEAGSHTARGVHPTVLPSWFHIVTAAAAVKPLTVAP
jgi:hypothetical protein